MIYYVLYNPLAGNGNNEQKVKELQSLYEAELSYLDITQITDYPILISSLESDDVLIICGGDGTLNKFINLTDGLDIPNNILYYAAGTGNDFLKDIEKTAETTPFSIKELIKDLPVAEINGKCYRFLNNVGFGIDGYCCEVGDKLKETSDKPVNYTAIAIKGLLFHFKPVNATVTVDGNTYTYKKVWIAPTMKGRFYGGGMIPTPNQNRADPDGTLSVMIFYGKGKLKTLSVFPSIFKGKHVKHKDMVAIHTGKDIAVIFDRPTPLQVVGETVLGVTSYHAMAKVSCDILETV